MTDKAPNELGLQITSVNCEVVVKDGNDHVVVRDENGKSHNIATSLPDIRKGHKGKLVSMGGKTVFVREPYSI